MDISTMDRTEPANILDLPRELLHNVLVDCNPADVAACRAACRDLENTIDGDRLLYKDLYLKLYDPPSIDDSWDDATSWESSVKGYTQLEQLFRSTSSERKINALPHLSKQIARLIKHSQSPTVPFQAFSHNMSILSRAFKEPNNREAFLSRSSLFAWASDHHKVHFTNEEASQASAKLHVFYGAPIKPFSDAMKEVRMDMFARSRVYDLRRYTTDSFWGPFYSDGSARVDWEKVQSIMLVVQYNLSQFHHRTSKRFPLLWHTPWAGIAPRSFVSPADWKQRKLERQAQARERGDVDQDEETKRQETHEEEMRGKDPYNVTGTWMRVVCFLDYSDLYSFNFTEPVPPQNIPRPALDQEEAIRLITMKLRVTKVEPGGEGQLPGSTVTHFEGTSRSMHVGWDPNANSGIRAWELKGTVSMTPEGEIRWTSFSVFHGEERWRSEGVQVGGVNSARGVWGSWFDKDFDPEGPAGPTAFWKLTDELPPNDPRSVSDSTATANYTQPIFVNNGMPNDRRNGQHSHGSPPGVGVFGAAATPEEEYEDLKDEDAAQTAEESHGGASNVANRSARTEGQMVEQQHPYDQTIMTDDGDEQEEVLSEIEELADGEGVLTIPSSSILEVLDAGGSSEEDDDDYTPPQTGR